GTRTGPEPKPKPRIKRFSECGAEGVEVDQCVRGDSVEGQRASRTVHIHCYSTSRGGGGGGDECFCLIVTDRVTFMTAFQTPGLITSSKQTVSTVSFPLDSSVTH
uniref:Uncharacterized protein n=1 Tax=Gasterosteus aculeatus TaxID=69293 RepID=G3PEM5_GASAC